jgi:hypothetical protein
MSMTACPTYFHLDLKGMIPDEAGMLMWVDRLAELLAKLDDCQQRTAALLAEWALTDAEEFIEHRFGLLRQQLADGGD